MVASNDFILLSGNANPKLAKHIAKILNKDLTLPVESFADKEIRVRGIPNLRKRDVFIIQPTTPPVNDHLMELILMIDAARRASAKEIIAIIPYFGYSRQDRKEMPRVPISSSIVASLITHAGANRILTVDIHSEQQEGFIREPWDNLYGSYSILPAIKAKGIKNLVIASPDKGGMLRVTGYARLLQAKELAFIYKERDIALNNHSKALGMIGQVKDKDILLVDDMIDTAGTIVNAANYLKSKGAKSIHVAATHGLFSGNAIENITSSAIEDVIVTDTIAIPEKIIKHPKVTVVSVAPLLSEAIKRIRTGESISKDLIFS